MPGASLLLSAGCAGLSCAACPFSFLQYPLLFFSPLSVAYSAARPLRAHPKPPHRQKSFSHEREGRTPAFSSPILLGCTSPVLAGNAPPCPVLPMPRVLVPSAPGALRSLHLAFPSPSLRAHNKRGPGETACPHEREGLMGAKGKRVKRLTMLPVLN